MRGQREVITLLCFHNMYENDYRPDAITETIFSCLFLRPRKINSSSKIYSRRNKFLFLHFEKKETKNTPRKYTFLQYLIIKLNCPLTFVSKSKYFTLTDNIAGHVQFIHYFQKCQNYLELLRALIIKIQFRV